MSKNVYTIDVVLENCEVVSFYIGKDHKSFVDLSQITKGMSIGYGMEESGFCYDISKTFLLLKKEDLVEKETPLFSSNSWEIIQDSDDITQIHVNKNGEEIFWGFVKWEKNSDYSNPYQKNQLYDDHVEITIKKHK